MNIPLISGGVSLLCIMYQSIPAAPNPPPGNCGAFARLVTPGAGALANLARPGGRAFAYPGATSGLLTRTWFRLAIQTWRIFFGKDLQFVADWLVRQGLDKLVEFY